MPVFRSAPPAKVVVGTGQGGCRPSIEPVPPLVQGNGEGMEPQTCFRIYCELELNLRIKLRIPGDMATCSDTIWPSIPKDVAAFEVPQLSGGLLVSVGRRFVNGFRLSFAH
jgi:hypothetical protein